jgi:hypothetical protein
MCHEYARLFGSVLSFILSSNSSLNCDVDLLRFKLDFYKKYGGVCTLAAEVA